MLLNLPQELRDHIFTIVCLSARSEPQLPTYRRECRRTCERQSYSLAPSARDRVWFERTSFQNPLLPLLLVNHQVHREAQDVLRRMSEPPNYAIDIAFLKDGTLWPTWLSVPKLQRTLGNVYAQFRIFAVPEQLQSHLSDDPYHSDELGPPPIIWLFYHLLAGFLRNGPIALERDNESGGFTVQNLILDFLPASEKGILPLASFIEYFKEVEDMAGLTDTENDWTLSKDEGLLAAECLAHFVRALLLRVLNLGVSTIKYGRILYENVGDIEIRVDGRMKWHLDLPKMFSNLSFDHEISISHRLKREHMFANWKEMASEKRLEAGLPIEILNT
ncbi:uncharacterized protein GGS22DRAFT_136164 [Annulohypoxylon maeteangense]|uniref:uncharacterized protein n=1 Tax=Annulohypoxylon maeteangense TaxID=1927788 RepID=UPI002007F4B9|nr:uncharacterized protein GGS22DRAFT_136164 [Annulohypoxylon maeteangense]KAI0884943.1 hypothetical protein GGS22DRAFT_136164 [Annulohypoxylon maeteangense]